MEELRIALSDLGNWSQTDQFEQFEAVALTAGKSLNNVYFADSVLQDAVERGLFKSVRVFDYPDVVHHLGYGGGVRDLIGVFSNGRFEDGKVKGTVSLWRESETARKLKAFISAKEIAQGVIPGLSVVITAETKVDDIGGAEPVITVTRINNVLSVDVVNFPASVGSGFSFSAREQQMPEIENSKLDELSAKMLELEAKLEHERFLRNVDTRLSEAVTLPQHFKEGLRERLIAAKARGENVDDEYIQNAIKTEIDQLAAVYDSAQKKAAPQISFGLDPLEKLAIGLERLFLDDRRLYQYKISESDAGMPDWHGIPPIRSIKDFVVKLTGNEDIYSLNLWSKLPRGLPMRAMNPDGTLSQSMVLDTLPEIFSNVINKALIRGYRLPSRNQWRELVRIVPVNNLLEQKRIRIGGFGNIQEVKEMEAYKDLGNLTEESVEYSMNLYGGIVQITERMIINDQMGVLLRIGPELAYSAYRTISSFVESFLTGNGTIYDDKALFHADHSNITTDELSSDSFYAGWEAMQTQTSAAGDLLLLKPKFLLVHPHLAKVADMITRPAVNMPNDTESFEQRLGVNVMELHTLTAETNRQWYLVADPLDIPTIEIGFLDGMDAPRIIVQDKETEGMRFTHDAITFKIKWYWGGAVIDYRGFYGGIPAA